MPTISKEVISLIALSTVIFLIAPSAIIWYVSLYNKKKKRHQEEKDYLRKTFENELLKSQMEVKEQTLRTVAAELHDNIGQILSLTSVTLSFIDPENKEDCITKVQMAEELVKRSVRELRQLSHLLYGEKLVRQGLPEAMCTEIEWLKKAGKYEIDFQHQDFNGIGNTGEKEIIVFRLFQEVVNNVLRHAAASRISIWLETADGELTLIVSDNGRGFQTTQAGDNEPGMGLYTIKRRAAVLGGSVIIDSDAGQGTQIKIKLPYP